MKKAIIPILTAAISMTLFTACHHDSLEDRAERDARDYTERYCPTPFTDNQRTDSITFTRADKTFHYFYTLRDEADTAAADEHDTAVETDDPAADEARHETAEDGSGEDGGRDGWNCRAGKDGDGARH